MIRPSSLGHEMSYALTAETALLLPLRNADIEWCRDAYDPVAHMGVPWHVTVIIPFLKPTGLSKTKLTKMRDIAASHTETGLIFDEFGRFPDNLHLLPKKNSTLWSLTNALCDAFPETPPYEGQFEALHLHATVAAGSDEHLHQAHAKLFATRPFTAQLDCIAVYQRVASEWSELLRFPLGITQSSSMSIEI